MPQAAIRCVAVVALAAAGACRPQLAAITGDTSLAQSRVEAEQALLALAARVSVPTRDAKYDSARFRIARSAFLPSRIWDDTAVWSASTSVRRTLYVSGHVQNGHYFFDAPRALTPITQLADSRHTIRLTRLSSDEFSWDTDIQYAIGSMPAASGGALLSAILAAAEGHTDATLRAEAGAMLPRSTEVFGQLFKLDSVRTTRLADGSTSSLLAITLTPDGIRDRYPRYADYLEHYARGARMQWSVLDHGGVAFLYFAANDGHILLRVRSVDGNLLALNGPARPLPDSLVLAGSFSAKVHHFTVGMNDYRADLIITRSPHERSLSIITRHEPDWVLPFVAERILRTPLRRPFEGLGALYRVGLRDDSTGTQTVLTRRMHLEVQESAILRFIGRVGSTAVSDYDRDVELQGDRWLHDAFTALATDVVGH